MGADQKNLGLSILVRTSVIIEFSREDYFPQMVNFQKPLEVYRPCKKNDQLLSGYLFPGRIFD